MSRFSILQAVAVEDDKISNSQFRVLAALGVHTDKHGYCFPSLSRLGKMLNKSKQAVSKDIQGLVELGYVEKEVRHRDNGSQTSNLYRLKFDLPRQPDIDPPSTPEVDPPSTPEVDPLTTHINDPDEHSSSGRIFTKFQNNFQMLTPTTSEMIKDDIEQYSLSWIDEAMDIAIAANKRNWRYVRGILKRWKSEGKNNGNVKGNAIVTKVANAIDAKVARQMAEIDEWANSPEG